jgi:threonine-phosphate decarboxylase
LNWPSHGSNPQYLYEFLQIPTPENYIDFSANINPLGVPPVVMSNWNRYLQEILQYPDPNTTKLKEAIARQERLLTEQIMIGNGGADLINLIGRILAGKKVLIIQPAFSEYEQTCKVNQCEVAFFQLDEGWEMDISKLMELIRDKDAVFLCNPNNPTGIYYQKEIVHTVLKECEKNNSLLILDEAFHDFVAGYESTVSLLHQYTKLVIIRSLTKMYSIPGLRLGYLMASPSIIQDLSQFQTHWSVNSVALAAGYDCLKERAFHEKTLKVINEERNRLYHFFINKGFKYSSSNVNFYLLKDPHIKDQYRLFLYLLQEGIVPRHTFNFPGLEGRWLRFAIKGKRENDRLMEVLEQWMEQYSSFS